MKKLTYLLLIISSALLVSCQKDEPVTPSQPSNKVAIIQQNIVQPTRVDSPLIPTESFSLDFLVTYKGTTTSFTGLTSTLIGRWMDYDTITHVETQVGYYIEFQNSINTFKIGLFRSFDGTIYQPIGYLDGTNFVIIVGNSTMNFCRGGYGIPVVYRVYPSST